MPTSSVTKNVESEVIIKSSDVVLKICDPEILVPVMTVAIVLGSGNVKLFESVDKSDSTDSILFEIVSAYSKLFEVADSMELTLLSLVSGQVVIVKVSVFQKVVLSMSTGTMVGKVLTLPVVTSASRQVVIVNVLVAHDVASLVTIGMMDVMVRVVVLNLVLVVAVLKINVFPVFLMHFGQTATVLVIIGIFPETSVT